MPDLTNVKDYMCIEKKKKKRRVKERGQKGQNVIWFRTISLRAGLKITIIVGIFNSNGNPERFLSFKTFSHENAMP